MTLNDHIPARPILQHALLYIIARVKFTTNSDETHLAYVSAYNEHARFNTQSARRDLELLTIYTLHNINAASCMIRVLDVV